MTINISNQNYHSGTALKSARASRKVIKTYYESKVVVETLNFICQALTQTEPLSEVELFKSSALEYIDGFDFTIKNKGIVRATALYKELWNFSKNHALEGKPSPLKYTRVDRSGIPLKLSKLARFWKQGGHWATYALTITSIHNTVTTGHPPVDLTSINGSLDSYPSDVHDDFRSFVSDCKLTKKLKPFVEIDTIHDVYASGAQGVYTQAFYSASLERQVLMDSPIKGAIKRLNDHFKRSWLNRLIDMPMIQEKVPVPETSYLRRLSVLPEKAHKHRIIVLSDFWSQNALFGIHRAVMNMLRNIDQDATYKSSEIISELSEMKPGFRDCIDLKNFTDFLPVSLQVIVLEEFFGKQVAEDWRSLMVEPVWDDKAKAFITYTRGQPMGLLSSWAVATLTHHYIMWWAGERISKRNMSYFLLGDDNVIMDKELSDSYTTLLEKLDIPQSLPKRLTTQSSGGLEFCKRLIVNGKEVTPIAWNVMSLGKVERYLDLYRLVNMRIDKLDQLYVFMKACYPNPILELDRVALDTYIELIRPSNCPESGVVDLSPKSLNPRLQAKVTKAAISLADLVDNAQEIIDYDPKKSNVRFPRRIAQKRVRGVVDNSTFIIYKIITLRYLIQLEKSLGEWEYRFKKIAGNGAIYVGGRIDWNLAGIKDKKETQFYKLEPALRFATKRSNVRHATLEHIKRFIMRSTDRDPDAKGSLLNIEKDLGAFIYRKCLHESLVDLLKYKGTTVSCTNLIDMIRKDIKKISPEIEHPSVNPSLIEVEYDYNSDEEFGG